MSTTITAQLLAWEFARQLRECLTETEMETVIERNSREIMLHIAAVVTGQDGEHNRVLLRQRAAIEAARSYVSESQRAA